MSTATVRAARRSAADSHREPTSRLGRWGVGLLALTLAAVAVAWLAGWIRFGTDPRVREILVLQEQARERYGQGGGPANLADATAAVASMTEIRQKMEQLPPHLRSQVERSAGNAFRSVFWARIDAYFALPPEQRQAELDRQINQDEIMRKAFEAGRSVMSALGGGQGTSSGQTDAQQPARTPWASRSEEERNRWRKSMIDRSSPQERARFTEYRRAIDARREQRGLPDQWGR
jgi:hypothetical protein